MSHVAWSVCLSVCAVHGGAVQKWQNGWTNRLVSTCGSKEPYIRWGPDPHRDSWEENMPTYHRRTIVQPCLNGDTIGYIIPMGGSVTFWFFYRETGGGQTPQLIVTQNGLNDADSGGDVPFGVKIESFCTTWPQPPKTTKIWPLLVWT